MKKISQIGLLFLVVITFLSGCSYYEDTYQGDVAYAIVSDEIPQKEETVDSSGKVQSELYSYHYTFDFITENGVHQEMTYELSGENPQPLEPQSIIKAKISKKRVLEGPNPITTVDVPQSVLDELYNF